MSKEILVIDDLRIFEFDAVYCRTIAEAIDALVARTLWNAVFWDHDLGGEEEVKPIINDYLEPRWATHELDPHNLGMNYIVTDSPPGQRWLATVFERWRMSYLNVSGMIHFRILDGA